MAGVFKKASGVGILRTFFDLDRISDGQFSLAFGEFDPEQTASEQVIRFPAGGADALDFCRMVEAQCESVATLDLDA